ncbi:glycoside hydrolase 5 family protein [Paenibacillus cymbidii]|uniref:hypothetical protein n=1 Tax=Paenibacillus cymbidii TaxID=1639034 RepID=UPI00107FD8FD|nr:hypothetical protein [Paenibacillus cymbidii]
MTSKLERNPYAHVRGFNYIPSYAFILNDIMDQFQFAVWEREFAYAEALGANSLRIWFSSVSFHRNEGRFLKQAESIVGLAAKYRLTLVPTLYNRWTDVNYPFGQMDLGEVLRDEISDQHAVYITQFMSSFRHDPTILMWDLCNEPFYYPKFAGVEAMLPAFYKQEQQFWLHCTAIAKSVQAAQPITFGLLGSPSPYLEELYRAMDVISFHPYPGWEEGMYGDVVESFVVLANRLGKPLLCNETLQGSLDDEVRRSCIESSLQVLQSYRIGWYAWQLCAGEMVSARRDRTDRNARPGDRGYMPFVLEDGSVRPGHDIIKAYNKVPGTEAAQ